MHSPFWEALLAQNLGRIIGSGVNVWCSYWRIPFSASVSDKRACCQTKALQHSLVTVSFPESLRCLIFLCSAFVLFHNFLCVLSVCLRVSLGRGSSLEKNSLFMLRKLPDALKAMITCQAFASQRDIQTWMLPDREMPTDPESLRLPLHKSLWSSPSTLTFRPSKRPKSEMSPL